MKIFGQVVDIDGLPMSLANITITTGDGIWTQTSAPFGSWHSIASDSTGQLLAAVQNDGYIFTSASG